MSYNAIISSNDSMRLEKLIENRDFFVGRNEYMQSVNDYYTENGTVVGYPDMSDDVAHNLDARVREGQPGPYPEHFFEENQKYINKLSEKIDLLNNNPEAVYKGWQFEGGKALVNLANNRLQLIFSEKPSDEQINSLKRFGFHWARTAKAWQRPLTDKVFAACDKIEFVKPLSGIKPSQMQPKQPKKNEPER